MTPGHVGEATLTRGLAFVRRGAARTDAAQPHMNRAFATTSRTMRGAPCSLRAALPHGRAYFSVPGTVSQIYLIAVIFLDVYPDPARQKTGPIVEMFYLRI